jgi:hypothetical protein
MEKELAALLNKYSQEEGGDTPDFLLAEYLVSCLSTWNTIVKKRDVWWNKKSGGLTLFDKPKGGPDAK